MCPDSRVVSGVEEIRLNGARAARAGLVLAALAAAATYFGVGVMWRLSAQSVGSVAYDYYGQFYPWSVHAWRSLQEGKGLLWNPYQDCGEPFFATAPTGLLYPVHFVFGVLGREAAFVASVILNLTIAGGGTYLLGRALGFSRVAALSAALAFELGPAATLLATWSPTHLAPFAWLPVALWRTERMVVAPSVRAGLLLATVLAIQLLPGFPQTVFFTYQLITLRVAWALALRQTDRRGALLGAAGLALVLPPLLTAVQTLPSLEVARESVRSGALEVTALGPGFTWGQLARTAKLLFLRPMVTVTLLAALSFAAPKAREPRLAVLFYALIALLYLVLSCGPGSVPFAIYRHLPLGEAFRDSSRLLWVTNFAMVVLAGFGIDAIVARLSRPGRTQLRPALALLPVGVALVAALTAGPPVFGLRRGDVYGAHAEAFAAVRERLTAQDRALLLGGYPDLALMPKSGTLFRVPNVHDYEAQESRAYADFFTTMRLGRPMRHLDEWYWNIGRVLLPGVRRPLLDLTAARYLVASMDPDPVSAALPAGTRVIFERPGVRVYENLSALERARFVPSVTVVAPEEVLPLLAAGKVDLRRTAVVTRAPASGSTGTHPDATGRVEFLLDDPERVVLRVHADAPGFLFLADKYFPGWSARIDGVPREILRANHTFRLVEVPAGESNVTFMYRPWTLPVGAVISLTTVVGALLLWRGAARR